MALWGSGQRKGRPPSKKHTIGMMKTLGLLLLFSGWLLVLAALVLLNTLAKRAGFITAGVAIEILGLGLLFRSQLLAVGDRR